MSHEILHPQKINYDVHAHRSAIAHKAWPPQTFTVNEKVEVRIRKVQTGYEQLTVVLTVYRSIFSFSRISH